MTQKGESRERQRETRRTTVMLVTVVMSFVVAELPQGLLFLLCGADNWYIEHVYAMLADVFDVIVLFNSSVNFLIYTTMSKKFRETFHEKLLKPALRIVYTCRRTGGPPTNGLLERTTITELEISKYTQNPPPPHRTNQRLKHLPIEITRTYTTLYKNKPRLNSSRV